VKQVLKAARKEEGSERERERERVWNEMTIWRDWYEKVERYGIMMKRVWTKDDVMKQWCQVSWSSGVKIWWF
jgi:hypothetical protein